MQDETCCKCTEGVGFVSSSEMVRVRTGMCALPSPVVTLESCTVFIPAVTHNKSSVGVKIDTETNTVFVNSIPSDTISTDVTDRIVTELEYEIEINAMYDVTRLDVSITDGLITIIIPTQKDRIKSIDVK